MEIALRCWLSGRWTSRTHWKFPAREVTTRWSFIALLRFRVSRPPGCGFVSGKRISYGIPSYREHGLTVCYMRAMRCGCPTFRWMLPLNSARDCREGVITEVRATHEGYGGRSRQQSSNSSKKVPGCGWQHPSKPIPSAVILSPNRFHGVSSTIARFSCFYGGRMRNGLISGRGLEMLRLCENSNNVGGFPANSSFHFPRSEGIRGEE